jgi:PAS domain S-box-containing protein
MPAQLKDPSRRIKMSHDIIRRILVVDDEKPYRTMIQQFLHSHGYIPETAENAFEALNKLRLDSFDLVISDIKMPDKDGLKLMQEVREKNPQIEFIIMTGHAREYSYSDIIAAGAVDFISKPFDMAELQAKLQRLDREKAILQDLRQSEEQYRRLVDNIPGSIFQANADWTVDFLDPGIEDIIGYQPEEFTSGRMRWSEIVLAEDIPPVKEIFKQALKKDRKYARKYRLKTKAGKIVWVRERSQIICDNEGRIEYINGIFFDITPLQEAEEALQKAHDELEQRVEERTAEISQLNKLLQTIFSVIPDLIILKDSNLTYLSINQAFCRFINQSQENIIGKNDYDLFPPDEAKAYQQADITIINSGTPQVNEEYITGALGQKWFQVVRTPVRDESGATTGILYSCRDITVRKKAEESIKLHRSRLQELSKPITED